GDVFDVGEADPQLREWDQRHFAGQELVEQVGDLRGVTGAVDAAGLDDRAGQAVGDHPLGHLVGLPLGLLVAGGEVLGRVLVGLVYDLAVGVAEDADRGDVDDVGDLRLLGGAEDAFGATDVGLAHRRALRGGDSHLIDRRGMDDRVAALHAGTDRRRVAEVAGDQLATEVGDLLALLGIADQTGDLVAALTQLAHHLAADEPRPPGHENLHSQTAYPAGANAYNH